jgi:transcriptional regulator with XRE-family HTH domain
MVTKADIGQRVRARRRALDLTQKHLAALCGCHYQVINGLERGRQSVYAERLEAVAAATREEAADYLMFLVGDNPLHPHSRPQLLAGIQSLDPTGEPGIRAEWPG